MASRAAGQDEQHSLPRLCPRRPLPLPRTYFGFARSVCFAPHYCRQRGHRRRPPLCLLRHPCEARRDAEQQHGSAAHPSSSAGPRMRRGEAQTCFYRSTLALYLWRVLKQNTRSASQMHLRRGQVQRACVQPGEGGRRPARWCPPRSRSCLRHALLAPSRACRAHGSGSRSVPAAHAPPAALHLQTGHAPLSPPIVSTLATAPPAPLLAAGDCAPLATPPAATRRRSTSLPGVDVAADAAGALSPPTPRTLAGAPAQGARHCRDPAAPRPAPAPTTLVPPRGAPPHPSLPPHPSPPVGWLQVGWLGVHVQRVAAAQ